MYIILDTDKDKLIFVRFQLIKNNFKLTLEKIRSEYFL